MYYYVTREVKCIHACSFVSLPSVLREPFDHNIYPIHMAEVRLSVGTFCVRNGNRGEFQVLARAFFVTVHFVLITPNFYE